MGEGKLEITAQDKTLSKKLLAKIVAAVESAFNKQELLETCAKGFEIIVTLANTIQSSTIIKAVKALG